jgi:hypothetical protein
MLFVFHRIRMIDSGLTIVGRFGAGDDEYRRTAANYKIPKPGRR